MERQARPSHATSRRWIDVALVAAGIGIAAITGRPLLAAPSIILGLVMPAIHLAGVRGRNANKVLEFVPDELAAAYTNVVRHHDHDATALADGIVLEAAAIIAGAPVRGTIQRRYVASRTALLQQLTADLDERATALQAARDELDALYPDGDGDDVGPSTPAPPHPTTEDAFATVLFWLLAPAFLTWDIATGLIGGTLLRARVAARLTARAVVNAARQWADLKRRVTAGAQQARRRFVTRRFRGRGRVRA